MIRYLIAAVGLAVSSVVAAQGALEVPAADSAQSGISVISGWHCNASKIEVAVDGGDRMAAAYGTLRDDTKGICGDANNGWSLLFYYGLFGTGWHTADAYADGVKFGSSRFYVNDFTNGTFLRGASGVTTVKNVTSDGKELVLKWQEAQQGFSVVNKITDYDAYDAAGAWTNSTVGLTITMAVERGANTLSQYVAAMSVLPNGGDTIAWLGKFVAPNRIYFQGQYSHLGYVSSAAVYMDINTPESATITIDYCYNGPNGICGVSKGDQIVVGKLHPVDQ